MSHPTSTFHPMTSGYADLERFDHDEREPGARHLSVLQKGRERQIAMIAHEMRNSLAVIRAATKLLKADGAGSLEGARSLIERHAGQMGRHLEELVDRRGAVREQAMHFAQTDLRVHVGHAIDAITPECRRRAHRLRVASMPEPVLVYADGERLEQVFANLLVNAAKYSADGGAIEVSMERRDGWVSVRVRDSGIGISPSMLPRIFDLFVQGEEASRGREDGQGIGLAVVRELVTKHGGSVQANSAGLGSGSEFTVTLPTL